MKLERAYTLLDVRSSDEEQRTIEGIASTPTPDRYEDVVEPLGAKYALPMPLLWQHRSDAPVGHVEFAKAQADGIPFKARILKTDEPGNLRDRLEEAWQSVKLGLIRAVSIGFRPLEYSMMDGGGLRFLSWEWLELSLVTIPANGEATINVVRSIDASERAASGQSSNRIETPASHVVRLHDDPRSRAREPFVIQTIHRSVK
ncbi:HK97 family phage prohead protease [Caballeronia sp. LZ035]|uniref:HK97 family phage prohead protease n=1 Tax=Caballeronia sp. LZ035 TaxID=3038568 RepID=UPI00286205CA|nr:HK97 family phage prohead protease [Caballeronia sp. LZ035]MDR5757896.1 HK97 family phage prohead protease [Caballeronia sp. LZ035]